jgi:hypothetical protein
MKIKEAVWIICKLAFLGIPDLDPDPLVRGMDPDKDPDPSTIPYIKKQKMLEKP